MISLTTNSVLRRIRQSETPSISDQKLDQYEASLRYAGSLQESVFDSRIPDSMKARDFFVYHNPKDFVSGDFYWFGEIKSKLLIAAADCTGHGVPGAMLSMLGLSLLDRAIYDRNLHSPIHILNLLDKKLSQHLSNHDTASYRNDGMDLSLCSIDMETLRMKYAGAYNSIYVVNGEIKELRANRLSVGGNHTCNSKGFEEIEFQLEKGDMIYMMSDGLIDQFGGPEKKKFKKNNLMLLLNTISKMSIGDQYQHIERVFTNWKGAIEQTDDVLVIGLKV